MKRKNKRFTNEQRLRADSRMLSKAVNTLYQGRVGLNPSERYGVSENQVELKRGLKTQLRIKLRAVSEALKNTKNPVKLAKTFIETKSLGQYKEGPLVEEGYNKGDSGKITITKKRKSYYKNRKIYRPVLAHELIHSMHIPNNDISANAFERYLKNSIDKKKVRRKPSEIVRRAESLEVIIKKLNKRSLSEYEKIDGFSYSNIGEELGNLAHEIEIQTRKVGSGMFFLKEILIGKSANFTISRISSGSMDKEIRDWLKMNPRLMRLLK